MQYTWYTWLSLSCFPLSLSLSLYSIWLTLVRTLRTFHSLAINARPRIALPIIESSEFPSRRSREQNNPSLSSSLSHPVLARWPDFHGLRRSSLSRVEERIKG